MAVAAIELLRTITPPAPQITDDIGLWLSERSVRSLKAHGINTLADLTVRVPRRHLAAALPVDDVSSQDVDLAGRFAEYVDRLRRFTDAAAATRYFNERMGSAFMELDVEITALNAFIEDFCVDIEKGLSAREALSSRGDRPRINHAIAAGWFANFFWNTNG